jgi:hypothetical protein
VTTIAVDGLNEEAFRRSIESRLRQGRAGDAVGKLRALLEPYAGEGRILPARFLTIQSSDLALSGWEQLGDAIARNDRDGWPITALSIAFGWPGDDVPQPDERGNLSPLVETSYFTDEAYPFSQSRREDLLEGYSYHGCTWASDCAATDTVLSLEGIDDLHGALAALEADLLSSNAPDEEAIRAGSLGACLLSALLFQAVDAQIKQDGLPRALCVLAGSNGVYPYFDAPVSGMPEDAIKAAEAAEEDETLANQAVPGPRYSSLLVTGIPRAKKRAVLVLEESAEQTALRNASLRGSLSADDNASAAEVPPISPPPDLAEAGIMPIHGGPLMAKKKPSEAWDFRDLLSSRDPDEPDAAMAPELAAPPVSPLASESDWSEADWPESEPAQDQVPDSQTIIDAPVPFVAEDPAFDLSPPTSQPVSIPTPAPGFDLLEINVQTRLESLIAQAVPLPVPATEVEQAAPEPLELEELAPPEPMTLPEGPVWCLGIGYLEDAEQAATAPQEPVVQTQPSGTGLWTRLRSWVKRGR